MFNLSWLICNETWLFVHLVTFSLVFLTRPVVQAYDFADNYLTMMTMKYCNPLELFTLFRQTFWITLSAELSIA